MTLSGKLTSLGWTDADAARPGRLTLETDPGSQETDPPTPPTRTDLACSGAIVDFAWHAMTYYGGLVTVDTADDAPEIVIAIRV